MDATIAPALVAKNSISKSFVLSAQSPAYVVYDQYDPAYTESTAEIQMGKREQVKYEPNGKITRTLIPITSQTKITKSEGVN